jgi:hypothetical protein
MDYELVSYDGAAGTVEMHARVPTLSASSDVIVYLALGDASLTTDGSSTSTWDSHFLEVYHFGNGVTLGLNSSVSGGHTLTNHGATASAAEVAGGAAHFVAASSQYIAGTSLALGTGDFTTEVIVKYSGVTPTPFGGILAIGNTSAGAEILQYDATGVIAYVKGALDANIGQSGWLHIAVQRTGAGGIKTWNNGSVSTGAGGGTGDAAGQFDLGNRQSLDEVYFDGDLDEVRVSTVKRSDDYITASYNNQKASQTFVSWGTFVPAASDFLSVNIQEPVIGSSLF